MITHRTFLKSITLTVWTVYVWISLFASAGEIMALMTGAINSQQVVLTPVIIRYLRELMLLMVLMVGLVQTLIRNRIPAISFYLFYLLFLLAVHLTVTDVPVAVLAGLRWFLPLLLPLVTYASLDGHTEARIARAIFGVFLIHFCLQVMQFLVAPSWYGVNQFGFAIRSPGIFLIPNTAAYFSIVAAFFVDFFSPFSRKRRFVFRCAVTVSVLLSASGTGVVVIGLYWIITLTPKRFHRLVSIFLPVFTVVGVFGLIIGPLGRGIDYVRISGGTRIEIFLNAIQEVGLFSGRFGVGTNTAVLLDQRLPGGLDGIIADSMPASVVINFGWAGLWGLFALLCAASVLVINKHSPMVTSSILIVVLFSMTTIITEVKPAGILSIIAVTSAIKHSRHPIGFRRKIRAVH